MIAPSKKNGMLLIGCLLLVLAGCAPTETSVSSTTPVQWNGQQSYQQISPGLFWRAMTKPSAEAPTRFKVLDECGVDFKNYMLRHRSRLLDIGSGVALADYDGDGLIDIYLTGSDISNKLFRNLGNLKFEDVTDLAKVDGRIKDAGVWSAGASFADIDNDGDLDLYVCNMASPNLLYVNQGDGTFSEETSLRGANYKGASRQANFCDYDRDGDLDFYLVTYQDIEKVKGDLIEVVDGEKRVIPGKEEYATIIDGREEYKVGEHDLLFRNDGTGHFEEVAKSSGIVGYDRGLGSVWFDHDDDGWQDLYVTSDFKQPDHLYRNNQDGTFTDVLPESVSRTPWFSMGVDVGDINNDGRLDLLVADMADRTHYGQKLNMGDMADSGWFLSYGAPRQFMVNCLFLNSGTHRFLECARQVGLAKSDWTWSVRLADLDLDGNQDVFFTNGHARDAMNGDIANQHKALDLIEDKELAYQKKVELNRNMPPRKESNLAYANRGNLKFESVGKAWGLDYHGVSHSAGFADLDLDGDLDCVVNNYYTPSLVYENTTTAGGRLLIELRSSKTNAFGVGSKVEIWQGDNYQRRDLLPGRGYLTSDPMMVHFGVQEGQSIDRLKVTWPDSRAQEFADLEPNLLYRVIDSEEASAPAATHKSAAQFVDHTQKAGLGFVHEESEFDDFSREPLLPFQLSRLSGSVACGDINGDGLVDVYCGGASGQSSKLFVNRGGTYMLLAGPWETAVQSEDMGALFFDADGDGKTDLYVASGGTEFAVDSPNYKNRLYRNMGDLEFSDISDAALPDMLASSNSVAAVDFDRDGDLDLFVGSRSVPGKYPLTPKSHLLVNDAGVFRVASAEASGGVEEVGLVNSAIWSDYDSDGWPDLLVAIEWGPVSVFKNNQGKLVNVTDSVGLSEQLGWWHGIAAGDLDADGDIDYVVTNQGLNTKYHATAEHPHRLYYDDFDESGSLDLVEAEFEGDVEYPVRGRSCSSRCMPFVGERFKTFHDYSLASISDIYQTDKKERPYRKVTHLQSSIIWNEGENQFRIEALPRLAQISPGYGVAIADLDSDSHLDIVMATNFFSSQPETGYMDGGLSWMLKGDGAGGFSPVWPDKSGIAVSGDANGLAMADYDGDGDLDLFFAINNDSYKLLNNQADNDNVKFELVGPPENSQAIGSQIVLESVDGNRQAFEITAGGSYLGSSVNNPILISRRQLEKVKTATIRWPDGTSRTLSDIDGESNSIKIAFEPKGP